jgi:hypothetical protein
MRPVISLVARETMGVLSLSPAPNEGRHHHCLMHLAHQPMLHQISESESTMSNTALLIITAILTLLIGVTLILVVLSLGRLRTSMDKSRIVASQAQAHAFDHLVLQDQEMRDLLHYSHYEALALVVVHDMEARFLRWKAGISDAATWQADQAFIRNYAQMDFVRVILQNPANGFRQDFVTYLGRKSGA